MSNEFNVVGIGFYISKKNVEYRVLNLMQSYEDAKYGVGSKVSQEFIKKDKFPDGLAVGDVVSLVYNRSFEGKAYVSGVEIVASEIPTVKAV